MLPAVCLALPHPAQLELCKAATCPRPDAYLWPPALLQGFKATFQRTAFSEEEWQRELEAPEPPFTLLTVADLLTPDQRAAYEAAGGEVL